MFHHLFNRSEDKTKDTSLFFHCEALLLKTFTVILCFIETTTTGFKAAAK